MKRKILKFSFDKLKMVVSGHLRQTITMPAGAIIRAVQMQGDLITLWAEGDLDNDAEKRKFDIYGTGIEINIHDADYIGTVQHGAYVVHVYENK